MDDLQTILKRRRQSSLWGIGTAAAYLRHIDADLAGCSPDEWAKHMREAEKRLVYCQPDMRIKQSSTSNLSPGSILDFSATITTARKDRDGDILDPAGAIVDEAMPLLWQHMPVQPLGRMLSHRQTKQSVDGTFAIADTVLGRDAATLVEMKALRISHGFQALEFEPLRGRDDGFHIKHFELYETSLVSVPSNVDAVITAFSRGKLHSPLMKGWAGRHFRSRPTQGRGFKMSEDARTDTRDDFDPEDNPALKAYMERLEAKVDAIQKAQGQRELTDDEFEAYADRAVAQIERSRAADSEGRREPEHDPKSLIGQIMKMGAEAHMDNHPAEYPDWHRKQHGDHIRVKGWDERLSTVKYTAKHAKWGVPIRYKGDEIQTVSEYEHAMLGVLVKFKAAKSGACTLTEADRSLLDHMLDRYDWCGSIDDGKVGSIPEFIQAAKGSRVKTIINDETSGGSYLNPEWFDRMVITFPLLHSELMPYVDVVDMPRGNAVESASIGNPTLTWNTTEGQALNLFTTDDLINQITSTVFPVAIAIDFGNDTLRDSLVNIGQIVSQNIGERHAQEMDKVIADGDGTTQPQGIMRASGVTDITVETPTTGPVTINDLLDLYFGVGKQYRRPEWNPRFVMTDTRYKSHRALATGVTGDDRLLHGMSVSDYMLLEQPVSIEQEGLAVDQGFFGALRKYRLWRRQGVMFRQTNEGDTLVRSDRTLIYMRARYAGKVVDANAFAVTDSWPTT